MRAPNQSFVVDVNAEVQDKGFLVTTTEELFQWARTGSLWWMTFGVHIDDERLVRRAQWRAVSSDQRGRSFYSQSSAPFFHA